MKAPASNRKADDTGIAFVTRKVVTETTQITLDPGGHRSPGDMLDEFLSDAVKRGDVIESIDLRITPEMWGAVAQGYVAEDRGDLSAEEFRTR